MGNDDTQQTCPQLAQRDLFAARTPFRRALLQQQVALEALGAAIIREDPGALEAAATDAFSYWFATLALFRRLSSNEPVDARRVGLAWFAVRTHHRVLVDLLARSQARIAAPELHRVLGELRDCLGRAIESVQVDGIPRARQL